MRYEEKYEKYLNGELSEEEAAQIREDVEKLQVLLGHMEDDLDDELFKKEQEEHPDLDKERDFTGEISKAVSRKFRRYAMTAGTAAVVIVLLLLYGLSPFLNKICFNPSEGVEIVSEEDDSAIIYSPFDMVMATYMELFCGEQGFACTAVRPEGYGRYTIDVQMQISGEITHHPLELVRNHLYRQDINWNSSELPMNAFTYPDSGAYCGIGKEEVKRKLADVPDALMIRAAVSFEDTKTAEEFVEFKKKYDTYYLYCPIVTTENQQGFNGFWGFTPKQAGYVYTDYYDKEKYPYLDIFEYEDKEDEGVPAGVYEKHVESMINYMIDHEEFLKIFDSSVPGENVLDINKYQVTLDYIKKHGINIYGTVVYASKQELLELADDEDVNGVYIMDSRLSL